MNRSMLAVLIGALMATGTVQAAAQDNTWYVGGKAGWSNYYGGITTLTGRRAVRCDQGEREQR